MLGGDVAALWLPPVGAAAIERRSALHAERRRRSAGPAEPLIGGSGRSAASVRILVVRVLHDRLDYRGHLGTAEVPADEA